MKKRQIVNLVHFIRGCEPRCDMDLVTPVREQIALARQYGLKTTFLVQYDALLLPEFQALLQPLEPELFEIGVWFEVVAPLCRDSGYPWRGRYPWDWHADVGFSVAYLPEFREVLVDTLFSKFRQVFHRYPRVFGSWAFDAVTLDYIQEVYGLDAACNCKDQWGTDGYTLWGGYYNGAYYPSRNNVFCPAQSNQQQIPVPVFRMLGSDPVLQYDFGCDPEQPVGSVTCQGVATLEPVYTETGGGNPQWVDWYFGENFSGNCVTYGYTQAGQENSFGWDSMKNGLQDQYQKLQLLQAAGLLTVETLGESGRWFRSTFSTTPTASIVCRSDYQKSGKASIWYNCKNYRVNLYFENGLFWFRDLYLFREDYPERYLTDICREKLLVYDNLPVIDGLRMSGNGVRAGLYLPESAYSAFDYQEDGEVAIVTLTGTAYGHLQIEFSPKGITVSSTEEADLSLALRVAEQQSVAEIEESPAGYQFCYRGYSYQVPILRQQNQIFLSLCST